MAVPIPEGTGRAVVGRGVQGATQTTGVTEDHGAHGMTDTGEPRRSPVPGHAGGVRSPVPGDALAFGQGRELPRALEGPALYQLLVESVRDYAIFVLDAGGHVLTWNPGAQRFKGYTAEEIIGRHFSIFYPPEDVAAGKTRWELEVAEREGRVEDEGWRVRKDGTRFWALVVITALRDTEGRLVGYAKVTRDLSERREAEEALRESEERFRLLVQSVREYAIFMLDPDGKVASWNAGAQRIKGYEPNEIIGRHFSRFYPQEDLVAGKPAMELEVASRVGRFEEEGWRVRKDGTRFWANVLITALRNDAGRLIGFAKVTRDLTERRAAEERALEDARRIANAEGANRAKSEFLAAMSHELRTPLNAIGGYVQLMEVGVTGDLTPQQLSYLARIRASQQHLLGIITDLLNYSRIEAGQLVYDLEDIPADQLLREVLPLVEPQAVSKRIAFVQGECPPGLMARADRVKAQQVILNLLSNAVKFTPEGGRVEVQCHDEGAHLAVRVSDNGPGIPEDKQAAIFEPFVQLGRTHSEMREGTGLGLAISRDLARAMGGDVTVTSTLGEGSTFTLTLPKPTDAA